MAIPVGQRLGPYEILSAIGAGGMGEVYRARDARLDRIVAIKILPDQHAARPELRERFEREARTIASLNHPHICTLFDVGHQNGTDYLVMEYLEGETLAERLKKGPLPLDQVLQYAIEISDALDKAHRKGITHRDLKPGNIMLTKSGTKLLDFGLAKLKKDTAPANVSLSKVPTEDAVTAQGTILGTLQYMAPEQLEGKAVDARTDIFAFGTIVYEMATGKKAFEGKSQASLISAIMSSKPPAMSTLQPLTPPQLDWVVKKCLAKEPEKRWQDASDLCDELKWIAEGSEQTAAISTAVPVRRNLSKTLVWAAVAIVACVIVGVAAWIFKPAPAKPIVRFAMSLPPGQRLQIASLAIAISPDATHLVYAAGQSSGTTQLYLRPMDGLEARPIPGTEGGTAPFFSPDGQWVGFSAGGKLKKILLSGGAPITLADFSPQGGPGATWSSQGTIAFVPQSAGPILQISDSGGSPQPLTRLEKGEGGDGVPQFLPGSRAMLFLHSTAFTPTNPNATIVAQSLRTGERRDLLQVQGVTIPSYASTGHLVYGQGTNLMAVPFDPQRLALTGAAVPVIEGAVPYQFSFSSTGSLVYIPSSTQARQLKLVWVDRRGAEQTVAAPPHNYVMPRVSPDGQRVAAGIEEADSQIWLYDLSRDTLTRLTFEGNANVDPLWTPDGKRIVFKGGQNRLFWQPADGSGPAEELTKSELTSNNVPGSFSPDGQVLVTRPICCTRVSERVYITASDCETEFGGTRGL
jgi:eukaryotic-like serine/threonine-protein kinase